ncbi:uncharacterized protein EI90DRAFT_1299083 [Cantharellus anzutake]|uniref:uncharacterized protein n=1 Tax=Cantharellus anzutake TaxID=1750568 RepID=UPI001904AF67|nr:uncharacterized protein EI90DRAFT_1299083 [Cantharellus anzutake]KAF8342043.1 hypothetical protein EI90DRAFT_1299083 [Cantharellus anzutake]
MSRTRARQQPPLVCMNPLPGRDPSSIGLSRIHVTSEQYDGVTGYKNTSISSLVAQILAGFREDSGNIRAWIFYLKTQWNCYLVLPDHDLLTCRSAQYSNVDIYYCCNTPFRRGPTLPGDLSLHHIKGQAFLITYPGPSVLFSLFDDDLLLHLH